MDGARSSTLPFRHSDDRFGPLWLLMLSTGLRHGEALGLRWEDVDFRASRFAVVQTVVVASNRVNLSEPKTAHSRRVVRLQSETVTALRRHQLRQTEDRQLVGSEWNELDLIFTTATGGPLHPRNIVRAFNQAVERADVPRIRIHDLRHTAATFAFAKAFIQSSSRKCSATPMWRSPSISTRTLRTTCTKTQLNVSVGHCLAPPRMLIPALPERAHCGSDSAIARIGRRGVRLFAGLVGN